jgi:hypothetical protein
MFQQTLSFPSQLGALGLDGESLACGHEQTVSLGASETQVRAGFRKMNFANESAPLDIHERYQSSLKHAPRRNRRSRYRFENETLRQGVRTTKLRSRLFS